MKIGVFPKVPDDVKAVLKDPSGADKGRVVSKYLFASVGRPIELGGRVIGSIQKTEIRMAPYPGEAQPSQRVYAIVSVDYQNVDYVRGYLERGIQPTDEVTNLAGEPPATPPASAPTESVRENP